MIVEGERESSSDLENKTKETARTERGREYDNARALKRFVRKERNIYIYGLIESPIVIYLILLFLKTCIFVPPRCVSRWVTGANPLVCRSGQPAA